ncbi:winged helix-turn-helix domain-containing protein [Nonomuraea sp. NPDC050383]|uniref:winged helix-turn-helix domain-containing protein n=1 Tax=Nonomuraea sp. NPDC050383 TaxID=3364362 RepID=UPI0037B69B13
MTDPTGRTLYLQIVDDLRSQIASGELRVGDPIPSTTALQKQYGHSITVVRKAVEVLRNEGLVFGQPGKAVYVQATPASVEAERVSVEDLAQQVADLRTQVMELRGTVEQLYTRLGHPYPNDDAGQPARHRKTGT